MGKESQGMTESIKVKKRIDARGLGAERDATGNTGWAEGAQSFNGLLSSLSSKYVWWGGAGAGAVVLAPRPP